MANNKLSPMKYNPDFEVIQANSLIRFQQSSMTMIEAKLLRVAIAQILKSDTDFLTYTCRAPELAELMEIPASEVYDSFKKMAEKLLKRVIYVPTGTLDRQGRANYEMFQWVSRAKYENGLFLIRLHDNLKPYLLELNSLFTDYTLSEILRLPSAYAIRLYELLRSLQGLIFQNRYDNPTEFFIKPNEIIFDIEYLRRFFDCESKYPNTGHFVKRVIASSVDAINQRTIMELSYRTITKGRKITHIVFAIGW